MPKTITLLLNRQEAAQLCGFSLRLLEYKTASGEMPGFCKPFGTLARWNRLELERWIKNGCPDMRKNLRNVPQENKAVCTNSSEPGDSTT